MSAAHIFCYHIPSIKSVVVFQQPAGIQWGFACFQISVSSLQSSNMAALLLAETHSLGDSVYCLNAAQGGQWKIGNLDPRQEADWFGNHQSATNV